MAWTLDHVGPMCKTVEDAALMLGAIAGYDEFDPDFGGCADRGLQPCHPDADVETAFGSAAGAVFRQPRS